MKATLTGERVEFLRLNGYDIRVAVRAGDGQRPPLLLFNGLGASLETFAPFVEALDPATTVIRFDVPGVGLSAPPRRPYRLWALAWLTAQLLDALNEPTVDVLGLSWGGLAAQQFALQHRARCGRLILASTCPGMVIPGELRALFSMGDSKRHGDPEYLASIAGEIYGGELRRHPGLATVLAVGRQPDPTGYRYQQLAAAGWLSVPMLPLLCQPTLILAGDDDPLIPLANAYLMHSLIPRAKLHIFPDGHLGLLTRAAELAPVVEAFLSREEPAAGRAAA